MNPNIIDLKPCPFCGERLKLQMNTFSDDCYVQCLTCSTSGPGAPDVESGVNQWNVRSVAQETCTQCGAGLDCRTCTDELLRQASEKLWP